MLITPIQIPINEILGSIINTSDCNPAIAAAKLE